MSPEQDEVLALVNEYRRLDRQLQSKQQILNSLLADNRPAGDFPVDFVGQRYRRYSIDFTFKPVFDENAAALNAVVASNNDDSLLPQEKNVKVDEGTVFRCAYVESFLRAVGTVTDQFSANPTTVNVTLPWNQRLRYFDFMWRIRDTGDDQEWNDQPQPSIFISGGYMGPFWLPRRRILSGGTVITTKIEPFRNVLDFGNSFFNLGSIQQFDLHISFVGHEVPDRGPL